MIDLRKRGKIPLHRFRRQHERVAAGEDGVRDLLMCADISDHLVEMACDLLIGKADEPLAEAVAAIHGAAVGRQDQRALAVLMLHAGADRVARLAARVERAAHVRFKERRDAHLPDGVVRVVPIDQRKIIPRDGHGKRLAKRAHPLRLLFSKPQLRRKCADVRNIVLHLFVPKHTYFLSFFAII